MIQVFKNTFLGLVSVLWFTSNGALSQEESEQSRPSKQKVGRGDRVEIEEAPSISLTQFKKQDPDHNHEDYIRTYKGQKLYPHTDLAAFHLNTARKLLSQDPVLLFELEILITLFHTFNDVPVRSENDDEFMQDLTLEDLKSDLYILSPWAYHLMRSIDHVYKKRRITLINQKYNSYSPERDNAITGYLNQNHEFCAEVWNFLKSNLSLEEYKAYQKKQAELSSKFGAPFRP